jgi:hypothetical protein
MAKDGMRGTRMGRGREGGAGGGCKARQVLRAEAAGVAWMQEGVWGARSRWGRTRISEQGWVQNRY